MDLLHDGRSWFSGVRDAVVAPRVNAEWAPVPAIRFRAGAGVLTKAPAVHDLYPSPQYYDVVNVNQLTASPEEHLAVLTTFIRDSENPNLGFSRATKLEVGMEMSVDESTVSLSAFRDILTGAVAIRPEPTFLVRDY